MRIYAQKPEAGLRRSAVRSLGSDPAPRASHAAAAALLDLQRKIGNRAARAVLQRTRERPGAGSTPGPALIQRFAFINEEQVRKGTPGLTSKMEQMVADSHIRNYKDLDEFKRHARKETDYLGNLRDGTWVRFSPDGINLLGEEHDKVTLDQVLPAVGSKSFIYELATTDLLVEGSHTKAAYKAENKGRFKNFGIKGRKDKWRFGAESLFPKMGNALILGLDNFSSEGIVNLNSANYTGQPVQRYLKIAWACSKDIQRFVEEQKKSKQKVWPKFVKQAEVHTSLENQLDKFITGLKPDGWLGDALRDPKDASRLLPLLTQFAESFTEAMVEMAVYDSSSRLTHEERRHLSDTEQVDREKKRTLFKNWRNFKFEDNVKAAALRHVRYAGMGQNHLDYLVQAGLAEGQHPFEMADKDYDAFNALTAKLKAKAPEKHLERE